MATQLNSSKNFLVDLKSFICRAINETFSKGKFFPTQRLGIITCIPKPGKMRKYLKNWRPITLLNVFYKITSGCIANRIKPVLNTLIPSTQTGFLKGRFIGENTRLIYDIMNFSENHNIPGLLVSIDFEKAFDSIAWSFINKTLEIFNFGHNIKKWIHILNSDITATVIQNGHLSEYFDIHRGCRQGDPISPYIFILCAEILTNLINKNKRIKGIKIGNVEHKISQFADDTTLILNGSRASFGAALDTLAFYANISGLKINDSKTKIIWIGSKNIVQMYIIMIDGN